MKPRIKKLGHIWICQDDEQFALGLSPKNAYLNWFGKVIRLPFGDWNKPYELHERKIDEDRISVRWTLKDNYTNLRQIYIA